VTRTNAWDAVEREYFIIARQCVALASSFRALAVELRREREAGTLVATRENGFANENEKANETGEEQPPLPFYPKGWSE